MKIIVHAKTGAKEKKVEKISKNEYKVWVLTQPEKGQANGAIIRALADHFKVAKSSVALRFGGKSKIKLFEIKD